ncbi:MAG: hypothetical protein WD115_06295 [Balneolaceae bacterium]
MIQELEERKRRLRADLDEIEARFETRTSRLGGQLTRWIPKGIRSSIPIRGWSMRSLPLAMTGAVIVIAFSSGWLRGGRRVATTGLKGLLRSSITGILLSEMRRMATKRAMHYVMDQLERRVGHTDSTSPSDDSESSQRSRR